MDEKQLQFLFNEYAKNKGFKDFGEFKSLMNDEGSRKVFFDDSNKELGFKDYNDFNETLGLKKKEEPTPSKPLGGGLPQNAIDINNPFKGMGKPVAEDKGTKIRMGDFKPVTTDNTRTIIPKLGSNQPKPPTIDDINKAIEHRVNTSTESAESVVQRFDNGDLEYDKESGKLKEVGSWLDNLGQGIKNTIDNIGLAMDIEVAKMNKNDNELKYYLNKYNEDKSKELETTYNAKGDFFKALPQEAGSFAPYLVGGALGIDAPMMGFSHSADVAKEIWQQKPNMQLDEEQQKIFDQEKINQIKNTSTDEKMIGTLQMALFNSLGITDKKQAKELLSTYAPTSKLFDASKNVLKALPLDMAKVGAVGAGGQILSNLTQQNEGRKVDWKNVPEAAESFVKMDLLFKAPQIFMSGIKVLADARNNGVDKAHPEWFNKYNADVQQQLHAIVSSPENIYNKLVSQLKQHENEPIAQDALTKIQTFRDYYKQLPSDLTPKSKEKALSILQLKTEAIGNAQNATENGIRAAYEQRAKTYDGLLQKLFEGEKVEDKEVLGLPAPIKPIPKKEEKVEVVEEEPIITEQEIKTPQVEEQTTEILNAPKIESPAITEVSEVVKPTEKEIGIGEKPMWKLTQEESFDKNKDVDEGEGLDTHEQMAEKMLSGYEKGKKGLSIENSSVIYRDENGKAVGFIHFDNEGAREMGVSKSERGKNIASKMIDFLKKEKGIDRLLPPFSQEGNAVSHRNEVKKAIERGDYKKAVDSGEMTVSQVSDIIKSAKLEVPKEFKETKAEVVEQQPIKEEVKVETPTIEKAKGFTAKEGNKVVDEKGEPLVVYHTSNNPNITEFKTKGRIKTFGGDVDNEGAYFTPNKGEYAHKGDYEYHVNLDIKNPYITTDQLETAVIKPEKANELKRQGYDGVILERKGKPDEYIVFDNSQIKIVGKDFKGEPIKQTPKEEIKPTDEFISKNGKHKIVYDEKGNIKVVDTKTGEEASSYITKKVINEKADSFDFSKGKKVEEEDLEGKQFKDEEELDRHVVENSENPTQIAEVFVMQKPTGKPLSTVEQFIAEFGIGRVTSSSWKRFGDRKVTGMSLAKSYLDGKRARGIDEVAREMSGHYGVEVTPQDIVDFMMRFPNGEGSAFKLTENEVAHSAKERFQELTGLPLNSETAAKAINYEFNKLNEAQRKFAEQQFSTERELEEAYWREHKATNGFTKESPSPETKPTEAKVKELTTVADQYEAIKDIKSKKAQENAKKELINNNFESIVSQLMLKNKIKRIC